MKRQKHTYTHNTYKHTYILTYTQTHTHKQQGGHKASRLRHCRVLHKLPVTLQLDIHLELTVKGVLQCCLKLGELCLTATTFFQMGGQKQPAVKGGKIYCFIIARILYFDTPESGKKNNLCVN